MEKPGKPAEHSRPETTTHTPKINYQGREHHRWIQAESGVPAFFQHVCADINGDMRCRIRLEAIWQDNGLDGLIDSRIDAITSFEDEPSNDNRFPLPALQLVRPGLSARSCVRR